MYTPLIFGRLYLLKNMPKPGIYRYYRFFTYESLRFISPISKLKTPPSIQANTPDLKAFFSHAPKSLVGDALLSRAYGISSTFSSPLNIETANWQTNPKIKLDLLSGKIKRRRVGRHDGAQLRYSNVHLAVDCLLGNKITQVHWDQHYPSNLRSLLKHFITDNIFR